MTTWFALYYSKPILGLNHPTILCASRFSVPLDSLCLSIFCASRFSVPLESRFSVPLDSLCLLIHCASRFTVPLDSLCYSIHRVFFLSPKGPTALMEHELVFLQHLQLKLGFSLLLHRICI